MVAGSERSILVADFSKFDKRFPARWAGWDGISYLVTEADPSDGLLPADGAPEVLVA